MYRNSSVVEYVTKHRALRKDMRNSGCSEIIRDVNEIILRFILNGLEDDPDWALFRSACKMFKKVKEPLDIYELEDWMLDDESEGRMEQEKHDVARWHFQTNRKHRKKRDGERYGRASESDDENQQRQAVWAGKVSHTYGNEQRDHSNTTQNTQRGPSGAQYYRGNKRQQIGQKRRHNPRRSNYDRRNQL